MNHTPGIPTRSARSVTFYLNKQRNHSWVTLFPWGFFCRPCSVLFDCWMLPWRSWSLFLPPLDFILIFPHLSCHDFPSLCLGVDPSECFFLESMPFYRQIPDMHSVISVSFFCLCSLCTLFWLMPSQLCLPCMLLTLHPVSLPPFFSLCSSHLSFYKFFFILLFAFLP